MAKLTDQEVEEILVFAKAWSIQNRVARDVLIEICEGFLQYLKELGWRKEVKSE